MISFTGFLKQIFLSFSLQFYVVKITFSIGEFDYHLGDNYSKISFVRHMVGKLVFQCMTIYLPK